MANHVGGPAGHVDGNDRPRAGRDRPLERGGVEVERALVDIGQDGRAARQRDGIGGRDERHVRHDDLVARAHTRRDER